MIKITGNKERKRKLTYNLTRHRASTSVYWLTFRVRVMLP